MNQKEILDIKNPIIEIKYAFSKSISRLDIVEKRISKLEDILKTIKIENTKQTKILKKSLS